MIKKAETSSLPKQTIALGNYLDEMLHDATQMADEAAEPTVYIEPRESALIVETSIEEVSFENNRLPTLDIKQENDPIVGIDNTDSPSVTIEPEHNKPSNHLQLSQFPIQCLMFQVGDTLLSLPLIQMSGVVPWSDNMTQLPQSPDWVFGVLKHRDCNLRVLDSSKILGVSAITGQAPGHILVLSDSQYAISCDILGEVVTLEYNDIQWHQDPENAISLGTIRETLAYLLSPSGIINSLNMAEEL